MADETQILFAAAFIRQLACESQNLFKDGDLHVEIQRGEKELLKQALG